MLIDQCLQVLHFGSYISPLFYHPTFLKVIRIVQYCLKGLHWGDWLDDNLPDWVWWQDKYILLTLWLIFTAFPFSKEHVAGLLSQGCGTSWGWVKVFWVQAAELSLNLSLTDRMISYKELSSSWKFEQWPELRVLIWSIVLYVQQLNQVWVHSKATGSITLKLKCNSQTQTQNIPDSSLDCHIAAGWMTLALMATP